MSHHQYYAHADAIGLIDVALAPVIWAISWNNTLAEPVVVL